MKTIPQNKHLALDLAKQNGHRMGRFVEIPRAH